MKTQCCQPPQGSNQCNDCPLTVPMFRCYFQMFRSFRYSPPPTKGEGTAPCTCGKYPHTNECVRGATEESVA